MEPEESVRLHLDWWGKCRTCKWWLGQRVTMEAGVCSNSDSSLHNEETWTEGNCKEWDSFDVDAALVVLGKDQT